MRSKTERNILKWLPLVAIAVISIGLYHIVFGRPSFNAEKVAQAETKMWQAYYSQDQMQLGLHLISFLRNQHGISFLEAKRSGELLAQASMKFRSAQGNYEDIILEDLTEAYRIIEKASGLSYDPEEVASAELAWWVARRTPGQNSNEQVGSKIAELYARLYGNDDPRFLKAGILRAKAAKLRDSGGGRADWSEVESLLTDSYRVLEKI